MNKAKVDRLIQEYSEWNHKEGLGFGFDDEALYSRPTPVAH